MQIIRFSANATPQVGTMLSYNQMAQAVPITHVGTGTAKVERVASTRVRTKQVGRRRRG